MSTSADRLMKQRRFQEAGTILEELLTDSPQDLELLIKLGICRLFSRRESEFVALHKRAAPLAESSLPAELAALWSGSQALFAKVSAAGLVIAAVGCESPSVVEQPIAPTDVENVEIQPEAPADVVNETVPDAVEVAPVEADPQADPAPVVIEEAIPETKPAEAAAPVKEEPTYSAHRYSAGIHRNKRKE